MDQVGQFVYLKSILPNLILLILRQEEGESADYADWCIKKLKENYEYQEITLSEYGYIFVENISVISNRLIGFYHLIDDNLVDFLLDKDYTNLITSHLRNFMLPLLNLNKTRKNIFLDRGNKQHDLIVEHDKIVRQGGPQTMKELEDFARYISNIDYDKIKLMFKDYTFINPEEDSFEEQITACANAKTIVVFMGASVANAYLAPEDCKIILINPNVCNPFNIYHDALDYLNSNVSHVFDSRYDLENTDMNNLLDKLSYTLSK